MIKAKKICNKCRKVKDLSCICVKPKAFENINKENYSFYNSTAWRKLSINYRRKHPLCVHCLEKGITKVCNVVDHITPIDKGGDKWNTNNLQPLCHRCHNKKSAASKKS